MTGKHNICVVTKPGADNSYIEPIYRFCSVLNPASRKLYLLASDEAIADNRANQLSSVTLGDGTYFNRAYIDFVILQIHISYQLLQLRSEIDIAYFHKGMMALPLPVMVARFGGINTCVIKLSALYSRRPLEQYSNLYITLATTLQKLSFRIAHAAVVFSQSKVEAIPTSNVFVSFSNYIDFERCNIEIPITERQYDLGFVGRFSEIKGVVQFATAAKEIVNTHPNAHVVLIGDGPLFEKVRNIVGDSERIMVRGWVEHNRIHEQYNQIQVLFAPSKSEGLPTTLLEAMGCGVVVASTPVGSVTDIVIDGETGFLLDDHNTAEMLSCYDRIQSRNDMAAISTAARDSVRDTYSKRAAQDRFTEITSIIATM